MSIILLYTTNTRASTNMFYDTKEGKKNISLIKILHINTFQPIIAFYKIMCSKKKGTNKNQQHKNKKMKECIYKVRKKISILSLIPNFNVEI